MIRADYASDPARTRGREFAIGNALARGPRTAFQRDRDRIIHSVAFRRLNHKTQVFVAPDGDHYRVRLTHSLEVAQIARVIARSLGLDEDLTEALALAHDMGHPPFGHAGESGLNDAMANAGGFDHNAHCLRIVMRLESPYCDHDGLNLCWETLEGLAKHNGPVSAPSWALAELDQAWPLELKTYASLEAQVAAISDDIAYDNHDIDDGIRAGRLDLDEVLAQPFIAPRWQDVERAFPDAPRDRQLRELIRVQIGAMVNNVIDETRRRLRDFETVNDVRNAGAQSVTFSPEMAEAERAFKRFMYDRLYFHPDLVRMSQSARHVLVQLFDAYHADPSLMPSDWVQELPEEEVLRARHIADYIAGMTDRFALARYCEIYGIVPDELRNV